MNDIDVPEDLDYVAAGMPDNYVAPDYDPSEDQGAL